MAGRRVIVCDGDSNPMWVGPIGDTAVIQDVAFYTLQGLLFDAEHYDATLASGGVIDMVVAVPAIVGAPTADTTEGVAKAMRIVIDGDALIQVYHNPTYTESSGAAITPVNRNEGITFASNVSVEVNPTVTAPGALRSTDLVTGGSGGKAIGADATLGRRLTFAGQSTLIRVTNQSGKVVRAVVAATWIEIRHGGGLA